MNDPENIIRLRFQIIPILVTSVGSMAVMAPAVETVSSDFWTKSPSETTVWRITPEKYITALSALSTWTGLVLRENLAIGTGRRRWNQLWEKNFRSIVTPFTSRFKRLLLSHLKSAHLGLNLRSCPFCDDQYDRDSLLIQHMELEHFASLPETEMEKVVASTPSTTLPVKKLQCPICNLESESESVGETERHVLAEHVDPLLELHLVCRECHVKVRGGIHQGLRSWSNCDFPSFFPSVPEPSPVG